MIQRLKQIGCFLFVRSPAPGAPVVIIGVNLGLIWGLGGETVWAALGVGLANALLTGALVLTLLRDQGRRIERLAHSEARARRQSEAMTQFAYIAAHDLQSPLATISGFAGLLQEQYAAQLNEAGQEYVDFLVSESQAASRKVEGLLAFSRVETQGKRFEMVDLPGLIGRVERSLAGPLAAGEGRLERGPLPAVVRGDATQLEIVFSNLIGNALKYRHPARQPLIRVSGRVSQWKIIFCVADNGQGIPAGYEDKVFSIFGRLHDSSTPGDGMGLAVARRIIERHGGQIWYQSEPGEGTRFYFSINN